MESGKIQKEQGDSSESAASAAGVTIQCSLTIGAVDDPLEHEADAMAAKVMRMPELQDSTNYSSGSDRTIQRKCEHCEEEEKEKLRLKPLAAAITPFIQKKETGEGRASNAVTSRINSTKGSGSSMDKSTQSFMENRFGADFSAIKIHTGDDAIQMSRELNAQAFTVGTDIYFNSGKYAPEADRGKQLLAHELTHTVQQGGAGERVQKKENKPQQAIEGLSIANEELELMQKSTTKIQPKIQRSVSWGGATVHETLNPAVLILNGGAPITWHQLNGTKMASDADADGAIKAPTISTSGADTSWIAKVDAVPAQKGSADETVLAPGPWSTVAPKADVGAHTGIAACSGKGNSTFSVNGNPSDKLVFEANRRHEDHHVADHEVAFNDTIGAWDKKVQAAKDKGTEFKGVTAASATLTLWAAMGGTPEEVARKYRSLGFAKGAAFHTTPKGGPMAVANAQANADCSVSSIEITNPS